MFKRLLLLSIFLLSSCSSPDKNTIRVGTIAGPETRLMEVAKTVAKKRFHLNVEIISFSDYMLPNRALHDGNIDVNVFQHEPYLDAAKKAQGYDFTILGKTFVYPMGIYSSKLKTLDTLTDNLQVAIPNDPSNEARALLLLEKAHIIKLKSNADTTASVLDITHNPHNIRIKELDAAQLPRVLPDVDLAIINTNFAIPAGLIPTKDALFLEDKHSPYANIIVARKTDQQKSTLKQFTQALQSSAVAKKAQELFKGQAIPAFTTQ